jgi:hypothetical protein
MSPPQCLVVGEILMESLVIVLNKIDLIPEAQRGKRKELTEREEDRGGGERERERETFHVIAACLVSESLGEGGGEYPQNASDFQIPRLPHDCRHGQSTRWIALQP